MRGFLLTLRLWLGFHCHFPWSICRDMAREVRRMEERAWIWQQLRKAEVTSR